MTAIKINQTPKQQQQQNFTQTKPGSTEELNMQQAEVGKREKEGFIQSIPLYHGSTFQGEVKNNPNHKNQPTNQKTTRRTKPKYPTKFNF